MITGSEQRPRVSWLRSLIVAMALVPVTALAAGCGSGPHLASTNCLAQARPAGVVPNFHSARQLAALMAGQARAGGPASGRPCQMVHFRVLDYYALVSDPGTATAYTAFAEDSRDVRVSALSSALLHFSNVRAPDFHTASERARWQAAGSPPLPKARPAATVAFPRGTFSFLPQGRALTYRDVRSLPTSAKGILVTVAAHLGPAAGTDPSATQMLRQLAFLLATAPLSDAARIATWTAVGSLPGLRLCGGAADLAGRHGEGICAEAAGEQVKIVMDVRRGLVLAVQERLLRQSALYPGVPAGGMYSSDTFLP